MKDLSNLSYQERIAEERKRKEQEEKQKKNRNANKMISEDGTLSSFGFSDNYQN